MKFDAREPIVFALSSAIPERYRDAVRDGVLSADSTATPTHGE
jgi:hypothetical protein